MYDVQKRKELVSEYKGGRKNRSVVGDMKKGPVNVEGVQMNDA